MLRAVNLRVLVRSCAVAIVAAVVCALEALSGAAANGDAAAANGDAAAASARDAAAGAPGPPPLPPDAGANLPRADRRRVRHNRRFGIPLPLDAGPPVDGGARDAVPPRFLAIRDGGVRPSISF